MAVTYSGGVLHHLDVGVRAREARVLRRPVLVVVAALLLLAKGRVLLVPADRATLSW